MNVKKLLFLTLVLMLPLSYTCADNHNTHSLIITVDDLRNSDGIVQYSLYNKDGTIPDENYKKYFRKKYGGIKKHSSSVIFNNLPAGTYAVNILHDENSNGKIDKGFIFPIEGIGFSNYHSIGLTNRPNFIDASFKLNADIKIGIKIIYL